MAIIACPECGEKISDTVKQCVHSVLLKFPELICSLTDMNTLPRSRHRL